MQSCAYNPAALILSTLAASKSTSLNKTSTSLQFEICRL